MKILIASTSGVVLWEHNVLLEQRHYGHSTRNTAWLMVALGKCWALLFDNQPHKQLLYVGPSWWRGIRSEEFVARMFFPCALYCSRWGEGRQSNKVLAKWINASGFTLWPPHLDAFVASRRGGGMPTANLEDFLSVVHTGVEVAGRASQSTAGPFKGKAWGKLSFSM